VTSNLKSLSHPNPQLIRIVSKLKVLLKELSVLFWDLSETITRSKIQLSFKNSLIKLLSVKLPLRLKLLSISLTNAKICNLIASRNNSLIISEKIFERKTVMLELMEIRSLLPVQRQTLLEDLQPSLPLLLLLPSLQLLQSKLNNYI
jgi:hypothetical protein